MAINKELTIDFFRIENQMRNSTVTFEECLKKIFKKSDHRKTEDIDGSPYRITELSYSIHHEIYTADMLKIRMQSIPVKAKERQGKGVDLNLNADEGIGEETAFLYYPKHKTLAIQRNKYGTSVAKLFSYLHRQTAEKCAFDAKIIIDKNTMEKYGKVEEFRKFNVSVSNPEGTVEQSTGHVMGEKLPPTPTLQITCSMGHVKGSLDAELSRGIIDKALSLASPSTKVKAEVVGLTELSERVVLDLVTQRMVEKSILSIDKRHASYDERKKLLIQSFKNRQHEIDTRYNKKP